MGELAPILENMTSLGFKKIIDFGYIEELIRLWLVADSYIIGSLTLIF